MKVLGEYTNGNYRVRIYSNGTKVRENDLDFFEPEFPESFDIKITNQCDMGCAMCHEDSTRDGRHGDILRLPFLNSIHPYTELAIGGGNPLAHPDLVTFLWRLKKQKLIPNITVNKTHFMNNLPLLRYLTERELIYGLGISYLDWTEDMNSFIEAVKEFPNAVIHIINGMISMRGFRALSSHGLKILILGYKDFRRGKDNMELNHDRIKANQDDLYAALRNCIHKGIEQ